MIQREKAIASKEQRFRSTVEEKSRLERDLLRTSTLTEHLKRDLAAQTTILKRFRKRSVAARETIDMLRREVAKSPGEKIAQLETLLKQKDSLIQYFKRQLQGKAEASSSDKDVDEDKNGIDKTTDKTTAGTRKRRDADEVDDKVSDAGGLRDLTTPNMCFQAIETRLMSIPMRVEDRAFVFSALERARAVQEVPNRAVESVTTASTTIVPNEDGPEIEHETSLVGVEAKKGENIEGSNMRATGTVEGRVFGVLARERKWIRSEIRSKTARLEVLRRRRAGRMGAGSTG
eukprot:g690.t1